MLLSGDNATRRRSQRTSLNWRRQSGGLWRRETRRREMEKRNEEKRRKRKRETVKKEKTAIEQVYNLEKQNWLDDGANACYEMTNTRIVFSWKQLPGLVREDNFCSVAGPLRRTREDW